jgi:hypothetical protein
MKRIFYLNTHLATMAPYTPLGTANVNTYVRKKSKISKLELSPHKRSVIKELYKTGCFMQAISEIENTPHSTVHNTLKLFPVRLKRYFLSCSEYTPTLNKVKKHIII